MTKIACVAVVRNEGAYLAEWLDYQFMLGFDTVLLLDNASTDHTVSEALAFATGGHDVRLSDWHETGYDYQTKGFEYAARRLSKEFDWVAFFDLDEFLVLEPELALADCLADRQDAAAIGVAWAIFGSAGHQSTPEGGVLRSFCRRSEAGFGPNRHIKSIIRPGLMRACLNPHMFDMDGNYRDLTGRLITFQAPGVLASAPDYRGGKLHHYFTRSREQWQQKLQRGYHDLTRRENEFFDYDRNEVFDDTAIAFLTSTSIKAEKLNGSDSFSDQDITLWENPLKNSGFVAGWEKALLGNRLSTFANLFAFHHRTGILTAYPQLGETASLIDTASISENVFIGDAAGDSAERFRNVFCSVSALLKDGYEIYQQNIHTITLDELGKLAGVSGKIVFVAHQPWFHDLESFEKDIIDFCKRGNGIILAGAFWYQYIDMRKLADEGVALKRMLRVNRDDGAGQRALVMIAAGPGSIRIGIHVRCADDYRSWINGRYFFGIEQYMSVMWRIHTSLEFQPHCFYVCSDRPIDRTTFSGLPVWYETGNLEDDFVALSKCHYVVGPPSTFGTWSAFLGGAKRLILTVERLANLPSWEQPLDDAIEVVFPTGGYLPGDSAAGPV